MLEVSPSDIHHLPGLDCHHLQWSLHQDQDLIDKIMQSRPTLQVKLELGHRYWIIL